MEFNSVDRLVSEIYDRSIEGNEAVYYHTDTTNSEGEPVLTVGTRPVSSGVELFVALSVPESDAKAGIPEVLEKSEYIDEFSDDWFKVNTQMYEVPVVDLGELTFSHYDRGRAWYTQQFSETNNVVERIKKVLSLG